MGTAYIYINKDLNEFDLMKSHSGYAPPLTRIYHIVARFTWNAQKRIRLLQHDGTHKPNLVRDELDN